MWAELCVVSLLLPHEDHARLVLLQEPGRLRYVVFHLCQVSGEDGDELLCRQREISRIVILREFVGKRDMVQIDARILIGRRPQDELVIA